MSDSWAPEDVLFVDCQVLTMDPLKPRSESLALRGGRVLAVGEEAELRGLVSRGAQVVAAGGATLVPAFHDSHVHVGQHGLELAQVRLHDAETLDEGLLRVAQRAAELEAGAWIQGAGFALERWGVESLDRTILDRVAPANPVLLRSQDHHSAWANSLALQRAGVNEQTPDPAHGAIVRDEGGEPSGLLLERALHLVWDRIPSPGPAEIAEAVRRAGEDLAARGIVTVHHMAYEPAACWREVASAASRDDYPLRVWACINQEEIEAASAIGLASGQGGGGFEVGGAKFFADGALGSRTAWMLEAYAGSSERGVAVHGPDLLAARLPLAIEAGLAPVTHAIGDAAVAAVLDALEATAPAWRAKGLLPRLEHAQHVRPADVERIARLGIVASLQPIHLTFDVPSIRRLLPDRLDRAYPVASLLRAGAIVAFGSDTPVAAPDVLAGLSAAVRRIGIDGTVLTAQEAVSPEQALRAYTAGAARAIGREGRSGMLAPGFDGDVTLLSGDPSHEPEGLRVLATVKAGRPTFDPEGLLAAGYTRV